MRSGLSIVACFGFLLLSPAADAADTAQPQQGAAAGTSHNAQAQPQTCPAGSHWVAAGYAKHAKYRAGHCAPN